MSATKSRTRPHLCDVTRGDGSVVVDSEPDASIQIFPNTRELIGGCFSFTVSALPRSLI